MKRSTFLLLVLACVMVLSASIGTAWAYFTTSSTAEGGQTVGLAGSHTDITETEVVQMIKHVIVSNVEGAPVYVRARAFSGSAYDLTYSGDGWADGGDGFWYYGRILNAGEQASELLVSIGNVPDTPAEGESFNVVVIYESTPVQHDASGNAYADWNVRLDTGSEGGD